VPAFGRAQSGATRATTRGRGRLRRSHLGEEFRQRKRCRELRRGHEDRLFCPGPQLPRPDRTPTDVDFCQLASADHPALTAGRHSLTALLCREADLWRPPAVCDWRNACARHAWFLCASSLSAGSRFAPLLSPYNIVLPFNAPYVSVASVRTPRGRLTAPQQDERSL
jgi:hypothetical protein